MRKLRLTDLTVGDAGSVFAAAVPAHGVDTGGVAVVTPGERSHDGVRHVHAVPEVFLILEGRGAIEVDGSATEIAAGDVLVIEPGEEHHLIGSPQASMVTAWLHLKPGAP